MRVTIASRRSDLARIQAYQVGDALRAAHPQIDLNYSFHESLGDKNLNDPLWKMPEKGVFTQDFREGLLRGEFDLVVHSWKDLAIENDPETEIVATLPRADARDLLLARNDSWAEVERTGVMTVLTSSPRRAHNLDSFLRDALPAKISAIKFENVRGNVPTRSLTGSQARRVCGDSKRTARRVVAMSLDGSACARESFGAGAGRVGS